MHFNLAQLSIFCFASRVLGKVTRSDNSEVGANMSKFTANSLRVIAEQHYDR